MSPVRNPPASPEGVQLIERVKSEFEAVERSLLANLPPNRERSLALTNLEQAAMWATKAIAEGHPPAPPPEAR